MLGESVSRNVLLPGQFWLQMVACGRYPPNLHIRVRSRPRTDDVRLLVSLSDSRFSNRKRVVALNLILRLSARLPVRPKRDVTLLTTNMCDDVPHGSDDDSSSFSSSLSDRDEWCIDRLFETIADKRSRYVLSYFDSKSVDATELDRLVDYVVTREVEESPDCETSGQSETSRDESAVEGDERHRRRVAVALHHKHLPKLDEATVVDYDPRSKTVRYLGGDRVSAGLELYEAFEDRWLRDEGHPDE